MSCNAAKVALLCAVGAIACAGASAAKAERDQWKQWSCDDLTPDLCDLVVEEGTHVVRSIPVRYWRYSRKASSGSEGGTAPSCPLIALHGGPGWPHSYLLPLRQLACREEGAVSEVIFYDQAGCGESTLVEGEAVSTADHPHLLDPSYYAEEELPALIDHWGLDKYHVLGHSWGTILAQNFALDARDTSGRLQSLVLSGPLSDSKSYIAAQWDADEGNLGSLPPFVQGRIRSLEEEGAYDSKEYQAINNVLMTFFSMRTAPAPDCFTKAAAGLNEEVYVGMQGASEFTMKGVLGDWNVTGRLHEIQCPVLLTHGAFDTMRPSIVKTMEEQLKLAERVMFPHSGHASMIDDAGMMNHVVSDFLRRVKDGQIVKAVGEGDAGVDSVQKTGEKTGVAAWLSWEVVFAFVVGLVIGGKSIGRNQRYTAI